MNKRAVRLSCQRPGKSISGAWRIFMSWPKRGKGRSKRVLSREKSQWDFTQDSRHTTHNKAVLVFGGFHKEGIKEILKRNGYSYVVITPVITEISERHQDYYKQLMGIGHYR